MLKWFCLASIYLLDALGLGDLYHLYRFLVELDTPDDELP
jgi:hypothetical protein